VEGAARPHRAALPNDWPRAQAAHPLVSMLRVHLMQNWFALNDPAMEEALYEIASLRSLAQLSLGEPIPDETTT
jgi:transposase, IS5 family